MIVCSLDQIDAYSFTVHGPFGPRTIRIGPHQLGMGIFIATGEYLQTFGVHSHGMKEARGPGGLEYVVIEEV